MPSTYAHYKMGNDIISNLNKEQLRVINSEKKLFQVGLHGPDIFYYFRLMKTNEVNRMGYELHKVSGLDYFKKMQEVYGRNTNKDKHLSYIYGSLCHYILDVECHRYIEEVVKRTYLSHAEIEIEFDKKLMLLDKEDPRREHILRCTRLTCDDVVIIKDVFTEVNCRRISKTLVWFRYFAGISVYLNYKMKNPRLRHDFIHIGRRLSKDVRKKDSDRTRIESQLLDTVSDELVSIYNKTVLKMPIIIDKFEQYLKGRELDIDILGYDFNGQLVG